MYLSIKIKTKNRQFYYRKTSGWDHFVRRRLERVVAVVYAFVFVLSAHSKLETAYETIR